MRNRKSMRLHDMESVLSILESYEQKLSQSDNVELKQSKEHDTSSPKV